MKKIFTLLAGVLLSMGAHAQTITWGAGDVADKGTLDGKTFGEGFVLTITDTDKSKLAIDGSDAYFGDETTQVKFTHRLKTGGKSSSKNAISLTIPSSGTLRVYARTGSNDAKDRNVVLTQNGTKLVDKVLLESEAVVVNLEERISGDNPTGETKVYPIIETKVTAGIVAVTYPTNGINFYCFEFESDGSVVVPLDPTPATTWDFTKELGTDDAANLAADATNWSFDSENGYWANKTVLTERNVFTALKANGAELAITKGLTFTRDNSSGLEEGRIRIAPEKFFAINGSAVIINFGTLAKDDVIRIRMKGAGESERSITPSNAEATEGSLTTADVDQHEVSLKVKVDGEVTLTPTNGFQFLAITINADLPVVDGISTIKAETTTDAPVYNLQGQRVDASYRGVVIKNGKKAIQK